MKQKSVEKIAKANNRRKRVSRKGVKNTDKNKLKKEAAFLFFLARNSHEGQTKKFLSTLLLPSQYTVLQEIAVNQVEGNLPPIGRRKRKRALEKVAKTRLGKLASGKLLKTNLHHLLDLLRILADDTITYHDLC